MTESQRQTNKRAITVYLDSESLRKQANEYMLTGGNLSALGVKLFKEFFAARRLEQAQSENKHL